MSFVSASPAPSTISAQTASTSQNSAASSGTSGKSSALATNINYGELFEDVDWTQVNLIDIEKAWRAELEQIEKVF